MNWGALISEMGHNPGKTNTFGTFSCSTYSSKLYRDLVCVPFLSLYLCTICCAYRISLCGTGEARVKKKICTSNITLHSNTFSFAFYECLLALDRSNKSFQNLSLDFLQIYSVAYLLSSLAHLLPPVTC